MLRVRSFLGVSLFISLVVMISGCGSGGSGGGSSSSDTFTLGTSVLGEVRLGDGATLSENTSTQKENRSQ